MNTTNLMPARRRAVNARASQVRRWSKIVAGFTLITLLASGAAVVFTPTDVSPGDDRSVRIDLQKAKATSAGLKTRIVAEKSKLASALEVSDQPDWSILLTVVSRTLGDEIVLTLVDATSTDSPAGVAPTGPRKVSITGVGRSQSAIAQFVLRLEKLGFCSRVELIQTNPQSLGGVDGIGFKIDCTVGVPPSELATAGGDK